ncbi:MAG: SPASM domain-containing protein, partial [candidate division NC10 bacterium]|nr:SPASM domain-containing protein [candidate division NC10 bacterium]
MTQHNIREAPDLIVLAKRHAVPRVSFRPLGLVGIEEKEEELIGNATYREFAEILTRALALAREHRIRTNLSGVMKKLPFLWTRYKTDRPKEKLECAYLWLQVFVSCDGDVTPCCALFMDEQVSLGNAFHGFHQAWNGDTYRDFRAAHVRNEVKYKTCWTCEAKTLGA